MATVGVVGITISREQGLHGPVYEVGCRGSANRVVTLLHPDEWSDNMWTHTAQCLGVSVDELYRAVRAFREGKGR